MLISEMWDTAGRVGTGLTLVAFGMAALVALLTRRLRAREKQLEAAPENERAALVQALNDSFLIPSLPADPKLLTPEHSYSLLLEQIRDRSRRFYVMSVLIIILAAIVALVTVIAINRSNNDSGATPSPGATDTITTHTADTSIPIRVALVRTYRFEGPFRIGRTGDTMTYCVTDVAVEPQLANKKIKIEKVAFKGHVSAESSTALGLDYEVLAFPDAVNVAQKQTATDIDHYWELERVYAAPRQALNLGLTADWGRTVGSKQPILWTVDLTDGSTSGGTLKSYRRDAVVTGDAGLLVQLFLWSAWGGDHFVEFTQVEITVTFRVVGAA